jgi:hypothetical protein
MRIVNSSDTTINVANPQTNETIATVPAKLVEMTYSTNFAPNEIRTGYFISTATNATTPNPGTTKGYSVFYEGNSTNTNTTARTAAEITTATAAASGSLLLTPVPPAVGQVFDSFELLAAPEVVAQEEAQTAEIAEGGDFNDGDDNAVVEEDDNGDDDGGNGGDDDGGNGGDDDGGNGGDDDGGNGGENNPDEFEDDDGGNGGDDDGGNGGDEGEGGGEGNDPNEFEGCIVSPGRDPGDVGC